MKEEHKEKLKEEHKEKLKVEHKEKLKDGNHRAQKREEEEEEETESKSDREKYQDCMDEIVAVAVYLDYKVKKLMEMEINHLRAMQEKLCYALLEKGRHEEELEMENKNLASKVKELVMERDILRKKLEYEREYSRIILDIEDRPG